VRDWLGSAAATGCALHGTSPYPATGEVVGWKTAERFPPGVACTLVVGVALSLARPLDCASHGASLFFARGSPPGAKKSKQKKARPFIRVRELRPRTPLLPPALRGPAYKGHPWPFIAGTPSPLAASMPLVPLRAGSTRPSARGRVISPVGVCMEKQSEAGFRSFRQLGLPSPSGGRTQALCRGTRGMDAERGTKGQGCPFVTCPRSNAGVREVWPCSGQTRMQGAPSLWLLLLGTGGVPQTRESDAPCKAQPVAPAEESAAPFAGIGAQQGGKRCAVFHPTESATPRHRALRSAPPKSPNKLRPVPTSRRAHLRSTRAQSPCA